MTTMKRLTIETLVAWAVREEWPKARESADGVAIGSIGSGWGAVSSYAALLAVIDENRYGVVPDLASAGEPHDDAVAVADALRDLEGAVIGDLDPEWLIGDLARDQALVTPLLAAAARAIDDQTIVGADGLRRSRRPIETVVVSAAILGARSWAADLVRLVPLRHTNGAEVWRRKVRAPVAWDDDGVATSYRLYEADVTHTKGRRPVDAYRVEVLAPDPAPALAARVVHIIWRGALRTMATTLADRGLLRAHEVVDDGASALPWLGLGSPPARVLPDLRAVDVRRSAPAVRKKRRIA